jgi:nicotinate dehydrogenase subunit B
VRVDESSVKDISGFVKVVVKGNFVGVVCEREEQAIRVARDLKVTWDGPQTLPPMSDLTKDSEQRQRICQNR